MTEQTTSLDGTNIAHSYGSASVLENVSITIEEGTVTALIGPNGSGKTTLIRALAGLQDPSAGEISYNGPATERPIGYLPQHPEFRPAFTALETIEFYADLVSEKRMEPIEYLTRVGLEEAASRPVEALSGGMMRLLGVAQATIGEPPIIILDEPGSGLDPGMRRHVFDVVADLARKEVGVLLSSHDLELVEQIADDVLVLADGKAISRGSIQEVTDTGESASLRDLYDSTVDGDSATVHVSGGKG